MGHLKFVVKDSGKRQQYKSGMVRDITEDKIDYTLILDGPMYQRWAEHLTKGARKYNKRNWCLANGQEELERFRESATRHFHEWVTGNMDEDHASGTFFNINAYEYLKEKLNNHK